MTIINQASDGDGVLEFQVDGVTYLKITKDITPGGTGRVSDVTISSDALTVFDTYFGNPSVLFKGEQVFVGPYRYPHRSGSRGDIVLPNNTAYRMTGTDGTLADPMIKLTDRGVGTPNFGRFRMALAHNTALKIDKPHGILSVIDTSHGFVASYLCGGNAGWIKLMHAESPGQSTWFSDKDDGKPLCVAWVPQEDHYQIINRSGATFGVSWAALGGL